jgi:hypothetical protein
MQTMHSNAVQNNSAANMNTNTTVLRIITDFPSYSIIILNCLYSVLGLKLCPAECLIRYLEYYILIS